MRDIVATVLSRCRYSFLLLLEVSVFICIPFTVICCSASKLRGWWETYNRSFIDWFNAELSSRYWKYIYHSAGVRRGHLFDWDVTILTSNQINERKRESFWRHSGQLKTKQLNWCYILIEIFTSRKYVSSLSSDIVETENDMYHSPWKAAPRHSAF